MGLCSPSIRALIADPHGVVVDGGSDTAFESTVMQVGMLTAVSSVRARGSPPSPNGTPTGLDLGSACSHRALWTQRRLLVPGVFTQVHELPTEAAARRWRGRVT